MGINLLGGWFGAAASAVHGSGAEDDVVAPGATGWMPDGSGAEDDVVAPGATGWMPDSSGGR